MPVEQDPNQDTTDLQKCMERLKTLQEARGVVRATATRERASGLSWRSHATRSHHRVVRHARRRRLSAPVQRFRVVILGAFGGRLDQEAQNLNALYDPTYRAAFEHVCLLSEDCIASLLPAGTTRVAPAWPFEGPTVGLLPLGQPVAALSTSGLRWDVADWACAFGHRMSTSNHVVAYDAWRASPAADAWLARLAAAAAGAGRNGSAADGGERHTATVQLREVAAAAQLELGAQPEGEGGATAVAPPAAGGGEHAAGDGAAVVTVTASHPIIWTATINAACVAFSFCAAAERGARGGGGRSSATASRRSH